MTETHISIVPTPANERNFTEKMPSFRKMPKVQNVVPKNKVPAEIHEPMSFLHNKPITNNTQPDRNKAISE